jgi:hypothetical protein
MTLLNAGYGTRAFYEKILNGLPTGVLGNWLCLALLSLQHDVGTPGLNSVPLNQEWAVVGADRSGSGQQGATA